MGPPMAAATAKLAAMVPATAYETPFDVSSRTTPRLIIEIGRRPMKPALLKATAPGVRSTWE